MKYDTLSFLFFLLYKVGLFIVPADVFIALVAVIFSVMSLSTCFGGMIVHFVVRVFVLLAFVPLPAYSSATVSATTTISASDVYSGSG